MNYVNENFIRLAIVDVLCYSTHPQVHCTPRYCYNNRCNSAIQCFSCTTHNHTSFSLPQHRNVLIFIHSSLLLLSLYSSIKYYFGTRNLFIIRADFVSLVNHFFFVLNCNKRFWLFVQYIFVIGRYSSPCSTIIEMQNLGFYC